MPTDDERFGSIERDEEESRALHGCALAFIGWTAGVALLVWWLLSR